MEEDDEIDVLGEFNLESLLTKNDDQISSCYDGDHQLGLHCESKWMLESNSQASWYDTKSDPQQSFGGFPTLDLCDSNTWTDKERYLLEKGLELFGRSWSRLAQYIGTKNANQVKSYVKAMGARCISKSSGSTSSFGVDNMDLNFSELINDMDIPASMEEVIAVVSTAQPTVVLPTSKRDNSAVTNSSSLRKQKNRPKKNTAFPNKRKLVDKPKEITHIYNAEDIKEVLTDNKESNHIVLPNGEQVIRIRHGSSVSEDSDVDVDVDSDLEKGKDELPLKANEIHEELKKEKEVYNKAREAIHCNDVPSLGKLKSHNQKEEFKGGSGVSLLSDNVGQHEKKDNKETQVFKASLMTPSGKIMTVIVDDMPCRLNGKDQCQIDKKNSTKTGTVLNSKKGEVDEETNHNERPTSNEPAEKHTSSSAHNHSENEKSKIIQETFGKYTQVEEIPKCRTRKRKLTRLIQDHAGGYTMMHTESGEVVQIQTSIDQVKTKRIKPVKLIQCKNHTAGNKAPYKVELDVSALVLVDVHSHLSPKCEVIGLLGGQYRPEDGVLSVTLAVPCRTILSSNIHCDMCPVSQLESSNIIVDKGLSIVGWYHSHPEFDPSPSDTDIETQNSLQSWFNKSGNPFVGLIISPYTASHHVSIYRCSHVISEKGNLAPYKLEVALVNDEYDIGLLRESIEAAYKTLQTSGSVKPRCVDSVKHHLRKAGVEEYKIVEVVFEICNFFSGKQRLKPSLVI